MWNKTMSQKTYCNHLVGFLTDEEASFFRRVFPRPSVNYDGAIDLLERHFKAKRDPRAETEKYKKETKELNGKLSEIQSDNSILEREKRKLAEENNSLREMISVLKTEMSSDEVYVRERMAILDALEAGGVDNWEWYGESIKNAGLMLDE